jgi:alpha-tubulin suppressor-like RCC1 family protein
VYGQLGIDDTDDRTSPTLVGAESDRWRSVSAGLQHTCAIHADHRLTCWGRAKDGRLGNGSTDDGSTLTPATVTGGATTWARVAAGNFHTCALSSAGALSCFGGNEYGQLGNGAVVDEPLPQSITLPEGPWAHLSSRQEHTCGVTSVGDLFCWGRNLSGQIGDGTGTNKLQPTSVQSGESWSQVSTGALHTCARRADGSLYCWGANESAQLGDGSSDAASSPEPVASP